MRGDNFEPAPLSQTEVEMLAALFRRMTFVEWSSGRSKASQVVSEARKGSESRGAAVPMLRDDAREQDKGF